MSAVGVVSSGVQTAPVGGGAEVEAPPTKCGLCLIHNGGRGHTLTAPGTVGCGYGGDFHSNHRSIGYHSPTRDSYWSALCSHPIHHCPICGKLSYWLGGVVDSSFSDHICCSYEQ